MSTFVVLFALTFVFGVGLAAGWKAAGANERIDRQLSLIRRDSKVDAEAEAGEDR